MYRVVLHCWNEHQLEGYVRLLRSRRPSKKNVIRSTLQAIQSKVLNLKLLTCSVAVVLSTANFYFVLKILKNKRFNATVFRNAISNGRPSLTKLSTSRQEPKQLRNKACSSRSPAKIWFLAMWPQMYFKSSVCSLDSIGRISS
ncbi:uncharacterized protein PHALS_14962 [Plasmopara halstedii]|uniref:Uncharacterized protein n=1 Tax=Plasmopara halstedii TaxID=4781 RepID=A0A0P1AXD6_PLAHL|nr:uncharacterized protein PHALS_14962 [Plasmopara halstedii]CEG47087.1 hypothetical protein PHALS_14962 [Plasmopara halstedii]|eukprot:XP_024583456.1 hypothetical protein PHALS_14962 [Plasmopara halstedii]